MTAVAVTVLETEAMFIACPGSWLLPGDICPAISLRPGQLAVLDNDSGKAHQMMG
jgi:hypothetical protein